MRKLFFILLCLSYGLNAQNYEAQFDTGYSYSKLDWVNIKSKRDPFGDRQDFIAHIILFINDN